MRNKLIIMVLAILALALPAVADFPPPEYGHGWGWDAGHVGWTRMIGTHAVASGGEFTIYAGVNDILGRPFTLDNSAYIPATKAQDGRAESFQTFCIELVEHMTSDVNYGWVSGAYVDGSIPGSHAWYGGVPAVGDDLTFESAYLYTQFAFGSLSNYDYTPGAGRVASAKQLQDAFWHLEEGLGLDPASQAATWVAEAQAAVADPNRWGDTLGEVRVLQLYAVSVDEFGDVTTVLRQDVLYVPAPAAVGLGLLGLGGIGMWMRKKT